jgi:two-component system, NarL family, response regulator NreC
MSSLSSTPDRPIRIVLVDDHEAVRQSVAMLLDSVDGFEVVGESGVGHEMVALLRDVAADVVVIDVAVAGANGLAATRAVKAIADVAVVALTRHADDWYVRALEDAGAVGLVLEQSASSELIAAIRAAAEGRPYLDVAIGDRGFATPARPPQPINAPPSLSERETVVLRDSACGYGNKEIATRLGLSVKTVEAHKANGMRKLGVRGRTDIVRYALLHGWLT